MTNQRQSKIAPRFILALAFVKESNLETVQWLQARSKLRSTWNATRLLDIKSFPQKYLKLNKKAIKIGFGYACDTTLDASSWIYHGRNYWNEIEQLCSISSNETCVENYSVYFPCPVTIKHRLHFTKQPTQTDEKVTKVPHKIKIQREGYGKNIVLMTPWVLRKCKSKHVNMPPKNLYKCQ